MFEIHGVTSFAIGCGQERRPGVYAKVDEYHDWIIDTVNRVNPEANFTSTYCSSTVKHTLHLLIFLPLLRLL